MLNVGIVGAGLIGGKRAQSISGLAQLVGVFDSNVERGLNFAQEFSCGAFSSADELIARVGPGGLLLCATPPSASFETAELALAAGLNVLVEKPGALNAAQMRVLVNLADQTNVALRIGYNHRFHPAVEQLRSVVSSGEYGEVQLIRARYGHGGRPGYEKEWRADAALSGGGEFMDQGSHLVDLVRMLVGDFTAEFVSLPTLYWDMNVEDNVFIAGSARGGNTSVWLHASWTEWKNLFSFEVFCKTAKLEVTGLGGSYGPETFTKSVMEERLGIPVVTSIQYPPKDESWSREMIDVLLEIAGKEAFGATGTDGLAVLQMIEGTRQ